ncbi:hypothetical protein GQ43DRAFT_484735 [Delitschia confertaspora ATCC 74209]|uniref:Uncharacterized protein n=1 Tax=Delitschia confertaspora ATCC 74209 TaxID=1513339 RepID=A0A9P4MN71_9PLEO|nr:hypothetical protein GQ43DRAFT_484735 [Delitschia confertaspora ATCC 74209]
MSETIFTFSQRGGHFFQCPLERKHARLPRKLASLLMNSRVSRVYHVTLGFSQSFVITYRDSTGKDRIESADLPSELHSFLYARGTSSSQLLRNIPQLRVILGPYNSSFFAHDGSSYRWMNLPSALLAAIKSRINDGSWIDKPRIMALGADSNFLLITQKNAAVWNLENYRTLGKLMEFSKSQENGIEEVMNVVLNPHRYECFVAESRNGMVISENLPIPSVKDMDAMKEAVKRDTNREEEEKLERERKRGHAQKRPSLNRQAILRRVWSDRADQLRSEVGDYKVKLSLSLNLSTGSIARMFS